MRADVMWWMGVTRRLPLIRSRLTPTLIVNLIYVVLAVDALVAAIALFTLFR